MNYIFLPLLLSPLFMPALYSPREDRREDQIGHVVYVPVQVVGPRRQEYIFISEDYQPFTHHYYPDDGSLYYGEDEPTEWGS